MDKNIIHFKGFDLNLNKRVGRTITKKEIIERAAEDSIKLSNKIVQTIFSLRTDKTTTNLLDVESSKLKLLYERVKYPNMFAIISVRLSNYLITAKDNVRTIILYIITNIDFGSNIIELGERFYNITGITYKKFNEGIITLSNDEFIIPTNKRHLYVVNHNHIFKGDYDDFVNAYVSLYRDAMRPETTYDNSKIILPKDYGKQ